MPSKSKGKASKRLALEDIENHLKKQDYEMTRAKYLAVSSAGVAVLLVGFTLAASKLELWAGAVLSVFLVLVGFGFISYCAYKWQIYKEKCKQQCKQDKEEKQAPEKDVLVRLERIEKKGSIAFGISIMVIGYNFFMSASRTDIKIASGILIILGLVIFIMACRGLRKCTSKSK